MHPLIEKCFKFRFEFLHKLQVNQKHDNVDVGWRTCVKGIRDVGAVLISAVYLDLGFDFTSEPDASLPLLPEARNEDFSVDGLGTRFLPERSEYQKFIDDVPSIKHSTHLYSLHSHKLMTFSSMGLHSFQSIAHSELVLITTTTF